MDRKRLSDIFKSIAILLEIKGENIFKIRSYLEASRIVNDPNIDLISAINKGTLKNINGIGEALEKKILEFYNTGKIDFYEKLTQELPEVLVEITKIPFIGPKRAKQIYDTFGIKNIDDVAKICQDKSILKIRGITNEKLEYIISAIEHIKASKGRLLQEQALALVDSIISNLKEQEVFQYVEITGEVRRFTETINELHFLFSANNKNLAFDFLKNKYKCEVDKDFLYTRTQTISKITFQFVEPEDFFWVLHNTSSSEDYLVKFFDYCKNLGYKPDRNLLLSTNGKIKFESEEQIYSLLNLQYVPPELREFGTIIEKARKKLIPKLIEEKDLKGMLHVHSNWSDGENTIEEIAKKCIELGYEYLAICDHSQSAHYANGLTKEKLFEQANEIDSLNKVLTIRILKGIESDINKDGSLDYTPDVLDKLDLVVASIHSGLHSKNNTERLIKALQSPYTNILGHPTGRLLTVRQVDDIDVDAILEVAHSFNKIIEINANPYRLDLPWQYVQKAKELGIKFAINPDSHRISTLTDVYYGIKVARKGGLEAKDVVNTYDLNSFLNYLELTRKS